MTATKTEVVDLAKNDMSLVKAKRLSERIADQCVKVEGEQGTLRRLLVDFSDGRGWKVLGHTNWEGWSKKVLPGHRSTAFRQLAAGQHERALNIEIGVTPESHLRDLKKVPADQRQEVMAAADAVAAKAERPRQASDVREAIRVSAPEVARPAASVEKDSVGIAIPDHLLGIFATSKATFDEGMRVLSQLKTLVEEMVEGNAAFYIGNQLTSLEQDRMNMFAAIKFSRPFAVCPYCKGKQGVKKCMACGDKDTGLNPRGWVNESGWKQSPVGKKADAKAPKKS